MHSTGSFLKTVLERVRGTVNLPDVDGMFKNPYLISNSIMPVMDDVWTRIAMTTDRVIVTRFPLTITANTEYFTLPPIMQEVHRIAKFNDDRVIEWDWRPRPMKHVRGPGWRIEGNTLVIQPTLSADTECDIWFTPSWSVAPHYATDGVLRGVASNQCSTVTLSASPAMGLLDKRESSYVGFIYRYLTGNVWQERIIDAYDPVTRYATLRRPLTNLAGPGDITGVTYEVAPYLHQCVWQAIAMGAAINISMGKVTGIHAQQMIQAYNTAIKTARDQFTNFVNRLPQTYEKGTMDNPVFDSVEYRAGGWSI